ncbi:MAG: nitrate reductase cytochrome c-type subunit [Gallionellaceae bacterium]|nr:nitrate reductase cytochrome c-type subunit [Gallionellaceae bacterium]
MMNRVLTALLTTLLICSLPFIASAQILEGASEIPAEAKSQADMFRIERDQAPIARNYLQQPPLIPHAVKGYTITKNFNKCLDCHSWARYSETGATKVSLTHFKDREGKELNSISPLRYFCTQCHVPQYNAQPFVKNTFAPVTTMQKGK